MNGDNTEIKPIKLIPKGSHFDLEPLVVIGKKGMVGGGPTSVHFECVKPSTNEIIYVDIVEVFEDLEYSIYV